MARWPRAASDDRRPGLLLKLAMLSNQLSVVRWTMAAACARALRCAQDPASLHARCVPDSRANVLPLPTSAQAARTYAMNVLLGGIPLRVPSTVRRVLPDNMLVLPRPSAANARRESPWMRARGSRLTTARTASLGTSQ